MDLGTLKSTVAGNIVRLRKAAGLTQAEVAEKLNYSDKAVSKWERANPCQTWPPWCSCPPYLA